MDETRDLAPRSRRKKVVRSLNDIPPKHQKFLQMRKGRNQAQVYAKLWPGNKHPAAAASRLYWRLHDTVPQHLFLSLVGATKMHVARRIKEGMDAIKPVTVRVMEDGEMREEKENIPDHSIRLKATELAMEVYHPKSSQSPGGGQQIVANTVVFLPETTKDVEKWQLRTKKLIEESGGQQ